MEIMKKTGYIKCYGGTISIVFASDMPIHKLSFYFVISICLEKLDFLHSLVDFSCILLL